MKTSSLLLVATLSLAACGAPGGGPGDVSAAPTTTTTSSSTTSTPPSTTSTNQLDFINVDPDDLGLAVVPEPDGGFASDLMVGCHSSLFPLSALDEIATIPVEDPDGYLAAIEPFLANEEGTFWPQDGWQLLWSDDDDAYLVAKTAEGNLAWMYLESDSNDWKWTGSSMAGDACHLRVGVPPGMNTINWRLDPERPSPTPNSTQLHLILNERECVSGQEIGDRLRGPQVVITPDEVRIVFVSEAPPGEAFNCQGNPDSPYVLELPEPLGDRELVDGFEVGVTLDDYVD